MAKGIRFRRTLSPHAQELAHKCAEMARGERIDAIFMGGRWLMSKDAIEALRRQTNPLVPSDSIQTAAFKGMPIEQARDSFLPRFVLTTRRSRRAKKWARVREAREHQRQMKAIHDVVSFVESRMCDGTDPKRTAGKTQGSDVR